MAPKEVTNNAQLRIGVAIDDIWDGVATFKKLFEPPTTANVRLVLKTYYKAADASAHEAAHGITQTDDRDHVTDVSSPVCGGSCYG